MLKKNTRKLNIEKEVNRNGEKEEDKDTDGRKWTVRDEEWIKISE